MDMCVWIELIVQDLAYIEKPCSNPPTNQTHRPNPEYGQARQPTNYPNRTSIWSRQTTNRTKLGGGDSTGGCVVSIDPTS